MIKYLNLSKKIIFYPEFCKITRFYREGSKVGANEFLESKSSYNDSPRNYQRTPGYIPSHLWRVHRKEQLILKHQLFDRHHVPSLPHNFLSTEATVSLLGKPARDKILHYTAYEKFSEINRIDEKLLENISSLGLDSMSHVQKHAIGILEVNDESPESESKIIGKYDLMAAAQTGSGKTLAFLAPIINRILTYYPHDAMESLKKASFETQFPLALVLAPTRELVQQINKEIAKLCFRTYIRGIAVYGGEKSARQEKEICKGCHLVAATPGRLLDFLEQGFLNLKHCRSLVIDEADRMLEMGFEPQLRKILESPKFEMPKPINENGRQTALFSATFPHEVAFLAKNLLRGDRCVSLSIAYQNQDGSKPSSVVIVPEWGKSVPQTKSDDPISLLNRVPFEIKQSVRLLSPGISHSRHSSYRRGDKRKWHDTVFEVIEDIRKAQSEKDIHRILVFCNTKSEVDQLDHSLFQAGIKSASLHGDKNQKHRDQSVEYFRMGRIEVLVATSVAARGLDFPRVAGVINAGIPYNLDDYIHRIGRTGRLGHSGIAVTIFDPNSSDVSEDVVNGIRQLILARDPSAELPKEFDTLAQSSRSYKKSSGRFEKKLHNHHSRSFRTFSESSEIEQRYGSQR